VGPHRSNIGTSPLETPFEIYYPNEVFGGRIYTKANERTIDYDFIIHNVWNECKQVEMNEHGRENEVYRKHIQYVHKAVNEYYELTEIKLQERTRQNLVSRRSWQYSVNSSYTQESGALRLERKPGNISVFWYFLIPFRKIPTVKTDNIKLHSLRNSWMLCSIQEHRKTSVIELRKLKI
jgi:hypothetical protein